MAPATTTVEWVGEEGFETYSGFDAGDPITLNPGDPTKVSPELAAHLAENFGHLVSIDGARPAKKNKPAAPPAEKDEAEEPDTIESLMKRTRPELDAMAAELGIADPEQLADKRTVATGILAVLEENDA